MIRQVRIKNFECYKDITLKFQPGLNTIIGHTDSGKSAIIRAIGWAVLHRNLGKSARFNTDDTGVAVETEHGSFIRFKGKSGNGYKVKGKKLVACGATQPDEIRQVARMAEINFQGQHDPPFLVSLTPGAVAQEINKIVDLGAIDNCQSWIKREIAKAQTLADSCENAQNRHKDAIGRLEWVVVAKKDWERVEACFRGLQGSRQKTIIMGGWAQSVAELERAILAHKINYLGVLIGSIENSERIAEFREQAENTRRIMQCENKLETLTRLIRDIEKNENQLNTQRNSMPTRCPTCGRAL